ncbi:thiamine-phosphate kinase [Kordiimonas pumila]|uniref:Thiamine-monophosphate kinase n=1 Tax=Kordiimonas pumila TaxID=2161677 RepID=A0ABV7D2B7_9PROT|nr:thiamine-phosphate kinase [Kordiimonas pumila]
MTDEFNLIARYFAPLAGPEGLGLKDDAACYHPKAGIDLVITKDVLVSGVHFFPDDDPFLLAQKALGVNLSDIAAKGAVPQFYFLGLCLPDSVSEQWLHSFSSGLLELQQEYEFTLAGGDTTSIKGPLVISITMIGHANEGCMTKRSGAKAGDGVFVTGTLGDAAGGLKVIENKLTGFDFLRERYYLPQPRLKFGVAAARYITAMADISDGLIADLGHICSASEKGATIQQQLLPISDSVSQMITAGFAEPCMIWAGGDDYELVFTANLNDMASIFAVAEEIGISATHIGMIDNTGEVRLVDPKGNLVHVKHKGFQHFR